MKRLSIIVGVLFLAGVAPSAHALDFSRASLPYSDVPADNSYALAISVLTSEGILKGNPDGTFRPNRKLNRAEFLEIAMLSAISIQHSDEDANCFPDVQENDWFSSSVCKAKELDIVSGYPDGSFRPEQNVNYAEALKMLTKAYNLSITEESGDEWFGPYLRTAESKNTIISENIDPDTLLTRGQMTELAAKFLANDRGELEAYTSAESAEEEINPEPEPEPPSPGPCQDLESSGSCNEEESEPEPEPQPDLLPNQTFTPVFPLPSLSATSDFMVLGDRSPVAGTVKVNPQDEPVEIRRVRIVLVSAVSSVHSFEVFDEMGYKLGTATLDLAESTSRDTYVLDLSPANAYFIDQDDEVILAVRPRANEKDDGGISGQTMQISSIFISATGRWTSRTNFVTTTGPDFQSHQTALAEIESIERDGKEIGTFTVGTSRKVGAFDISARSNKDGDPALESLSFSISSPSEVSLSNAFIRSNDSNLTSPCTATSSSIVCSSVPSEIGSLQAPRTLSVFADVSLTGDHPDPFLQVYLNIPGRPGSAGDITWTDGDTSFTWVPFDTPVVSGTSWE